MAARSSPTRPRWRAALAALAVLEAGALGLGGALGPAGVVGPTGVAPAAAALVECLNLRPSGEYKVLLDDLSFATDALRSDRELQVFMERLRFVFENQIEALRAETEKNPADGGAVLIVVQCEGRRPTDGNEFDRPRVEALNTMNAIVEMWVRLDVDPQGRPLARVGYLLVPIRLHEAPTDADLSGLYFGTYLKESASGTTDLVALFEKMFQQEKELKAYVAVGAGVKSLKARRYDVARQYLCRAEALMKEAWPRAPLERRKATLMKYVGDTAVRVVADAKFDAGYRGPLRLLADGKCPHG